MDGKMKAAMDEIVVILKNELALYKDLLEVLKRERTSLVSVKLKEIREATLIKETLLSEIHREEIARARWNAAFSADSGIDVLELTVDRIIDHVGPAASEALANVRTALKFMILETKQVNSENQKLTESALREAHSMKENALGMSGDRAVTYGPKGAVGKNNERNARLVSHEA